MFGTAVASTRAVEIGDLSSPRFWCAPAVGAEGVSMFKRLVLAIAACLVLGVVCSPALAEAAAGADDAKAAVPETPSAPKADTGDTAWVLAASALVMLMLPGLALFYAGMVRR